MSSVEIIKFPQSSLLAFVREFLCGLEANIDAQPDIKWYFINAFLNGEQHVY